MRASPADQVMPHKAPAAFSLIELLVAMAVLSLLATLLLVMTSSAQGIAKQVASRTEQFREARRAFDRINQRLSQATLNPYWDYVDASGQPRTPANAANFNPRGYARLSDLRYIQTNAASLTSPRGGTLAGQSVFFQAPLGKTENATFSSLTSSLNTVGYFLDKGSDQAIRPPVVQGPGKVRYRLFELVEPTEALTIYSLTSGNALYDGANWFTQPLAVASSSHRLAENIVALLFLAQYKDANGDPKATHSYTSSPRGSTTQPVEENNLPPSVRVTMLALDEISARRVTDQNIALPDAIDDASLQALEDLLRSQQLNYRKFESTVSIGASAWSTE